MKANAPEKIYLQVCGDCQDNECENCKFDDFEDNITWCKDRIFPKDIEYTRTDAFIEKAVEFMEKIDDVDEYSWYNEEEHAAGITEKCIEDFKNYMKGGKV